MSEATVTTKSVNATALKQELGRRRNNKARRAAGEPTVRTKAYYLGAFSVKDVESLLAGETVRVEYKSGRVEDYVIQ
jgi:hypothetical protein